MNDDELLNRFVMSFAILDRNMRNVNVPEDLRDNLDQSHWAKWHPERIQTEAQALLNIYSIIPGRLPPLFEKLLLSYRWLEVDLRNLRLLQNPPGKDLSGFLKSVLNDKGLTDYLFPRQLVPFGRGPNTNYDPVCFDLTQRNSNGDCKIVQVDHENIFSEIESASQSVIFPSFKELMIESVKLVVMQN